jgi:SulP family sulfate permease
MLALLVGLVQLALGAFKLGVVVNFLSHPVIVGFTNAAAIIIGLSQMNKLIGVPMGRSEHFMQDIWGVVAAGRRHAPADAGHGRGRHRHHVGIRASGRRSCRACSSRWR